MRGCESKYGRISGDDGQVESSSVRGCESKSAKIYEKKCRTGSSSVRGCESKSFIFAKPEIRSPVILCERM